VATRRFLADSTQPELARTAMLFGDPASRPTF
jgi:hypothetical protein